MSHYAIAKTRTGSVVHLVRPASPELAICGRPVAWTLNGSGELTVGEAGDALQPGERLCGACRIVSEGRPVPEVDWAGLLAAVVRGDPVSQSSAIHDAVERLREAGYEV